MEKFGPTKNRFDLLRDDIEISLDISVEAAANLPFVTEEDRKTGREKFAALLGEIRMNGGNRITIEIKAVYQEIPTEMDDLSQGSYRESEQRVDVNLSKLRKRIESVVRHNPEYRNLKLVGDVHTHPTGTTKPSEADIANTIRLYETGTISNSTPFIFGIGAQVRGRMEYKFYNVTIVDRERGVFRCRILGAYEGIHGSYSE